MESIFDLIDVDAKFEARLMELVLLAEKTNEINGVDDEADNANVVVVFTRGSVGILGVDLNYNDNGVVTYLKYERFENGCNFGIGVDFYFAMGKRCDIVKNFFN